MPLEAHAVSFQAEADMTLVMNNGRETPVALDLDWSLDDLEDVGDALGPVGELDLLEERLVTVVDVVRDGFGLRGVVDEGMVGEGQPGYVGTPRVPALPERGHDALVP